MQPLADKLRPKTLDEVLGQRHLLAEDAVFRRAVTSGDIPNMVFYGPPGVGKTTIADIIARNTSRSLVKLNATQASTADIKHAIETASSLYATNGVLLYLDEIQYFSKKQQQSLLEVIESGRIALISSTTENPYFYVYPAILSRSTVFEFKPLEACDIAPAVQRAFDYIKETRNKDFQVEDGVVEYIAKSCGGDVRKSLNAVEFLTLAARGTITIEDASNISQKSALRFDRDGDSHYDILSAFQKSLRGSDENAAIHYLARLLEGGDMLSACRRMLVTAAEDVGLAYPNIIPIVKACCDSARELGMPEARIPLANAVILIATAPKSNSAYLAIDSALADIRSGKFGDIPPHIKDSHYGGAKKLGRGQGYQYPHAFEHSYVHQQYLPDEIKDSIYYNFGENKAEQAAKAHRNKIKGDKR